MPHGRRLSSSRCRRFAPTLALFVVLAGCGGSAPGDDATADSAAVSAPADAVLSADSLARLARLRALADSAERLDTAFQRLRDSLDAERRALASLDRRTAEYARRWDDFLVREREATSIRARRDSVRAAIASLATPSARDSGRPAPRR